MLCFGVEEVLYENRDEVQNERDKPLWVRGKLCGNRAARHIQQHHFLVRSDARVNTPLVGAEAAQPRLQVRVFRVEEDGNK